VTVALIAFAVSILAWPTPHRGELRLRRLIDLARLAQPAASLRSRRRVVMSSRAIGVAGALLAGAAATAWRGPVVGVAASTAAGLVSLCIARAAARRSALAHDRDLSAALRLLRAELDVGSSGPTALSAAARVAGVHRPVLDACARAARDGDDLLAATTDVAARVPAELVRVAQAWHLADVLGVPLADLLARVDDDVQARRTQARVVASAALAGPRSSAALLAGLPVLGILLGVAMQAHPLAMLFGTTSGQLLLCAGVLLDATGVVWTERLVTSAARS
jgi:tight adherence protein B